MALQTFIICAAQDSQALQDKILSEFGDGENVYIVRDKSQWLVAANMTTREVFDKIELKEGNNPNVVIFLTANYWGYHHKDMWEWLELD